MYGPKGVGRSGFGVFTAAKRAQQAATDATARGEDAATPPVTPDAQSPTAGAEPPRAEEKDTQP